MDVVLPTCKKCNSKETVKNGTNGVGNKKYKCKKCGFSGVIKTKRYSENFKNYTVKVTKAKFGNLSYRKIGKEFNISHQTVVRWFKETQGQEVFILHKLSEPIRRFSARFKDKSFESFAPESSEYLRLWKSYIKEAKKYYASNKDLPNNDQ